jgi:hypothetical protein
MAELPTRYYVQISRSDDEGNWTTEVVTFDQGAAEQYAGSFERAVVIAEGDNISAAVATIARVVTAEDLRAAEGEDALTAAEIQTRVQFWEKLAEWAEPLEMPENPG